LNQHCIRKANQCVALRAGDTATAEIVTGQRKIIDYVLDPFKRLSQDGLKL
jgi:HlyD family secretion protein